MVFHCITISHSDCSFYASITPSFVVNHPSLFSTSDNITFLCVASAVTRNASLVWMVDSVIYNSTGVFNSSKGQLIVQHSSFDARVCKISSSLTVLNAQSKSQGVYICILQDNSFILSKNNSVLLQMENSTKGLSHNNDYTIEHLSGAGKY